ncbi:hypothetical protein PVAP13_4KG232410 [Panicum virgatum]|uniref:PAZ domain-containing protein n=1 Tax=Panicum virgatum TaxID=38727 RepID=A0A8T0TJ12_PANVG|nr:hypothetical protein PVAP13_4KG232410 [Panicum virgatum]
MLLAGYPTDIRAEALQVLDIVDDIFVVDVSSTVPIEPLLLIDFVQKIFKIDILNGKFTKAEYAKLLKALSDMRIEGTNEVVIQNYRAVGLLSSSNCINDSSFESPPGPMKKFIDDSREKYNLELKYKFLPCLQVCSEQKMKYLPIEVCKIVPRQLYQKKLEASQVASRKMQSRDDQAQPYHWL